jgi:glycosyltransferase involved in cell wall biosynthesis
MIDRPSHPERPRVTIGIPVYNGEKYLEETLRSIQAQTFRDFELVISDNASADRTQDICRAYAADDPRIRYFRNPSNIGLAKNFGRVVELATARYFKLANADDISAPTLVEKCVEVLDRAPDVVLCYGQTILIDGQGAVLRPYEDRLNLAESGAARRFDTALRRIGLVNVLQGVMRTAALRRTGLLGSYLGSDVVLVAELALYGKFTEIPERLFYRRIHDGAFSSLGSAARQRAYVDPRRTQGLHFHFWRHLGEHLRAIFRAPVPLREKLQLLYVVARRAITSRGVLVHELSDAMLRMRRDS